MITFADFQAFTERTGVRYEINPKADGCGYYFGICNPTQRTGRSEWQWVWFESFDDERSAGEVLFFAERYSMLTGKSHRGYNEASKWESLIKPNEPAQTYKATHKEIEGKTREQVTGIALRAMERLTGLDNGTRTNPHELASSVMPDGRTLIQTIWEDGACRYSDGWHIVEVDGYTIYCDLSAFALRTMIEQGDNFDYIPAPIL